VRDRNVSLPSSAMEPENLSFIFLTCLKIRSDVYTYSTKAHRIMVIGNILELLEKRFLQQVEITEFMY